ncbi:MAG: DUF4197 family protein [Pseudomonadota bacterium]
MRHLLAGILLLPLLSSCTGGLGGLQQDLTRAAQEQLMRTLAGEYTRRLGGAVDAVVNELARPGGYLDDPLTRILLPPPLGLALGAVRDLQGDPQAGLLSVLINQAAEQAIPVASPILRTALAQITPAEARGLLDGGVGAGTGLLRARTAAALKAAVRPRVATALAGSDALRIYGELLDAYRMPPVPAAPETVPPAAGPVTDLEAYVTDGAVEGLFAVLAAREAAIRDEFENMTGGMLQGPGAPRPE